MVLVIVMVAVLLVVGITVLVVRAGCGPALRYASERHSTNKQGVGANVC